MKIKQVRSATLVIEYAGKKFLVDPMLAEKEAFPGFEGAPNSHLRNPLVDLPVAMNEILAVDAVIVTHTHVDHWDDAAKNLIPKNMPVFAQNEKDAAAIQADGFSDTCVLTGNTEFDGITLIKTPGQHGTDEAYAVMGEILDDVCGVVFRHVQEKTLYLAGDTIWNGYVEESLKKHAPDVIILNCGDVQAIGLGSIIMDKEDVSKVHEAAPEAIIVASHMEALGNATLSRQELRGFLADNAMMERVLVPEDGEVVSL